MSDRCVLTRGYFPNVGLHEIALSDVFEFQFFNGFLKLEGFAYGVELKVFLLPVMRTPPTTHSIGPRTFSPSSVTCSRRRLLFSSY
jgi:hypothetical protein